MITDVKSLQAYKLKTDVVDLPGGQQIEIHELPLSSYSEVMQFVDHEDNYLLALNAAKHGCDLFKGNDVLETLKPSIISLIGGKVMELSSVGEDEAKNSESSQG